MGEGTVIEAAPGQRYVIERPRLTRLLDESNARIILLLGPAGYGKTTLARQWLAQGGRRSIWFRVTPALADVAAFAAELARLVEPFQPEAAERLMRHLHGATTPDTEAARLARTIAAAIEQWPQDMWVTLDDYQAIVDSPADKFIETLADSSQIPFLLTARTRPAWISARRVLYGEVLSIEGRELALTADETRTILTDLPGPLAGNIAARARGWPAVIRLAALGGCRWIDEKSLPDALHDYFAEELFQAAAPDMQETLVRLAAIPSVSPAIVAPALHIDPRPAMERAAELGFLSPVSRDDFELHPLLRVFLEQKLRETEGVDEFIGTVVEVLTARRRWDDAFALIKRFELPKLLPNLIDAAVDDLLDANRATTLREWILLGSGADVNSPTLKLAEAELARRNADFARGAAYALSAAADLPSNSRHLARAYAVGSECAYFDMDGANALRWGQLAEEYSVTSDDKRRAVWDQLLAAVSFEIADQRDLLQRFEGLNDGSRLMQIRTAVARLTVTEAAGGNIEAALRQAEPVLLLLEQQADPLATSGLLHIAAHARILIGDYLRAVALARSAIEEASRGGINFAPTRVTPSIIRAMIGMRRSKRAEKLLSRLTSQLPTTDTYQRASWFALRARLLFSVGALGPALTDIEVTESEAPTVSLRAECIGLRAIILATAGEMDPAMAAADEATGLSDDVIGTTLAFLARALVALQIDADDADPALAAAEDVLVLRANYDSLVTAYRGYPPLLRSIRERQVVDDRRLAHLVREARDAPLAASIGWDLGQARLPQPLLSPRESEVYELMCRGFTNKEIARTLFISEATAKVHVRHILAKLGARSRTEAVARRHRNH